MPAPSASFQTAEKRAKASRFCRLSSSVSFWPDSYTVSPTIRSSPRLACPPASHDENVKESLTARLMAVAAAHLARQLLALAQVARHGEPRRGSAGEIDGV